MGNKSKFKQIKKLAAQMPEVKTYVRAGEVIKVSEAVNDGLIKTEELPRFHGSNLCRIVKPKETTLNHERKMKDLYVKHGAKGVSAYMRAIAQHTANSTPIVKTAEPLAVEEVETIPTDSEGAE